MKRQLWCRDDGELVVVEKDFQEGGVSKQWSLTIERQRCTETSAKIVLGPTKACTTLAVYVPKWPRVGAHHFWSMASLYSSMGLQSFKRQWSK